MIEANGSRHQTHGTWLDRSLHTPLIFAIFVLLDFPHQYGLRDVALTDSVLFALANAALYTFILVVTTRADLARVTICYLALPYLIFIPGWLNTPTAAILLILLVTGLAHTLSAIRSTKNAGVSWRDLFAFTVVLVWTNISGIGAYGFQWADYAINNARLHDLVTNDWPIRYGENRNFVYYFGYFLPAAAIGKLSSVNLAIRSLYPWAVLGIVLALRWLSVLTHWRVSVSLALVFALFGPLDIVNLVFIKLTTHETLRGVIDTFRNDDMDTLVFGTSMQLKHYLPKQQIPFFLGNFPGTSFQLYWSPQQLLAGWLGAALLVHLYLQQQFRHFIFAYALLLLWAPLPLLALSPFTIVLLADTLLSINCKQLFSFENTLVAGVLTIAMTIFYLGGSNNANPSFWLWDAVDLHANWKLLLVFYLAAWGWYALAMLPYIATQLPRERLVFFALLWALFLLPLRIFGEWSDLLCRGSAPLMFLLLVFVLRALRSDWQGQHKRRAGLLACLMLLGTSSAFLINHISIDYYGQTELVRPLPTYQSIYPNFGPDDSLFNHLFRRALPRQKPLQ